MKPSRILFIDLTSMSCTLSIVWTAYSMDCAGRYAPVQVGTRTLCRRARSAICERTFGSCNAANKHAFPVGSVTVIVCPQHSAPLVRNSKQSFESTQPCARTVGTTCLQVVPTVQVALPLRIRPPPQLFCAKVSVDNDTRKRKATMILIIMLSFGGCGTTSRFTRLESK